MWAINAWVDVAIVIWCTWMCRNAADSARTLASVVLKSARTQVSEARMQELVSDLNANDSHRALAILLKRAGGEVEVTEAEIASIGRFGALVATPNRVSGTITLEYREPVGGGE